MKTLEIIRDYRGRQIEARAQVTENGIDVLVAGGDLAHIGAVSVVGEESPVQTHVFPGHREAAITEEWAARLGKKFGVPIVVSAGIHYDNITKEEISGVMQITGEMLEELITMLQKEKILWQS